MPEGIQQLDKKGFRFLHTLYRMTQGSQREIVDVWGLGKDLGLSEDDTCRVADCLNREGLLQYQAMGGGISITHDGVSAVERAMSEPDVPTRNFPPVRAILVDRMIESQVRQEAPQSGPTVRRVGPELDALVGLVSDLRSGLPEMQMTDQTRAEAEADLKSLEAQLGSPHPKVGIIRECLDSLRAIIGDAANNTIESVLLRKISRLM
jgi:hypothetical protein